MEVIVFPGAGQPYGAHSYIITAKGAAAIVSPVLTVFGMKAEASQVYIYKHLCSLELNVSMAKSIELTLKKISMLAKDRINIVLFSIYSSKY